MTEVEYRGIGAVNQSMLKYLQQSPLHYKYAVDNPKPPTPDQLFGGALHKYVLQPESFGEEYAVCPACDRRTKEGKALWAEFCAASDGLKIITEQDMAAIIAMRDALMANKLVRPLLAGDREVPLFWKDERTGLECKGRMDAIINTPINAISDYKSCKNAATEPFLRAALNYGYDVQAAHYLSGARENYGKDYVYLCIAQEKEPPYAVNVLQLDDPFIEHGRILLRRYMDILADCIATGNWYGYEGPREEINVAMLPAWAAEPTE